MTPKEKALVRRLAFDAHRAAAISQYCYSGTTIPVAFTINELDDAQVSKLNANADRFVKLFMSQLDEAERRSK